MTTRMTLAAAVALLATGQAFASGPNEYSLSNSGDATITYGTTTFQQQGTTTYQQPQGTAFQQQGVVYQGQNDVYQNQPVSQGTVTYGTTGTTTGSTQSTGFGEIVYDSQPYQPSGATETYAAQPSTGAITYDQYGQPVTNESAASWK